MNCFKCCLFWEIYILRSLLYPKLQNFLNISQMQPINPSMINDRKGRRRLFQPQPKIQNFIYMCACCAIFKTSLYVLCSSPASQYLYCQMIQLPIYLFLQKYASNTQKEHRDFLFTTRDQRNQINRGHIFTYYKGNVRTTILKFS